MTEDLKRIEAVLDEKVRPALRAHGGEIAADHLEDGVLYVKLLGQCAGCPSADLTSETIVEAELTAALPEGQRGGGMRALGDGRIYLHAASPLALEDGILYLE